jgi:hypothetical protein
MFNIRRYWQEIREEEARIGDKEPFLVSIEDRAKGMAGGMVVQVKRENAARLILAKTHRLATGEEIEQYERENLARVAAAREESLRRAGQSTYALPPKMRRPGARNGGPAPMREPN